MEIQVQGGEPVMVTDSRFTRPFNESLVHQVIVAYMAAGRAGTKAQKTRAEVSGGGKKPWRQKGTGRARAGTIRSPLWRGGGKSFAAQPRDHSVKLNKKMFRAGMQAIISELLRQERLKVVSDLSLSEPKTRLLVQRLEALGVQAPILLVPHEVSPALDLAARNLPRVAVVDVARVDPVSLVRFERTVMTPESVRLFEERIA